jgi:branched-subunit amino acid transport protein
MAVPPQRGAPGGFYPRAWLYLALAALVVASGFYPSYFARLGAMDGPYHLHGVTAALWMALLVAQPLLHRLRRWDLHRRLGRLAFLLVPAIVVGGLVMVHRMLNSPERYPPDMAYQLAFIDFYVLVQLVLFFGLAMKHRRDMHLHARYMVGTVFGVLIPAMTRLLLWLGGVASFGMALHLSYVTVHVVILLLLVHDHRTGGIRLPYTLALGMMVAQQFLMTQAAGWSWWRGLMQGFAGIGVG